VHFEFSPLKNGDSLEVLKVVESNSVPELPSASNKFIADAVATYRQTDSMPVLAGAVEGAFRLVAERMRAGALEKPHVAQLADFMIRNEALFQKEETETAQRAAQFAANVLRKFGSKQQAIRDGIQTRSHTAVSWLDGNGVDEFLLARGKHQSPSTECRRGLPQAFACAEPIETPDTSGRLELARQFTDRRNPLTSRVIVNRVWHHLFGRGIVATTDNFGWLGERPSHPELLDRLAYDFIYRHQWSLKALIRQLVLSRTYAMTSKPSDARAETLDPENLLLHRMPLRRLEAEALRDAILAVSGRLDRAMLGKPVPVYLTEFIIGRERPKQSGPLDGAGRRSVYTTVRRNFLPTLMLTFDTPTPFSTVGRRTITNVPAQSLALLNDDFIYEQAGVWADHLLGHKGDENTTDRQRVDLLFRAALGRPPGDDETGACLRTLEHLREDTKGEPAAWKELCHSMFTLNEFLYVP
jgi:hypothetical protein